MGSKLTDVIQNARDAGVPLLAVTTPNQQGAISEIAKASNGAPKVAWDGVRGVVPLNDAAGALIRKENADPSAWAMQTANPQTALEFATRLPADSLFFMVNAHRFVADAFVSTGILNLRDVYKSDGRTFVMVAPSFDLPVELQQDVVVIDDPMPDDEALRTTIKALAEGNNVPVTATALDRAVDATRGLSAFACEQVTAMSLRKSGIDLDSLWERKRLQIAQTKGVSLLKSGPRLSDIGGNSEICQYGSKVVGGTNPPRAIWMVDEIEKHLAGSQSDGSGVTADYLGVMLREMEDSGHDGMILVSPPGCGKTMFAKALAIEFGLPCVLYDFGAMKGRFVGDSEAAIRSAFKVGNGIAAGRALVIATCNKLDVLPAELRRRFTNGIWYFDLPTEEERNAIWTVQLKAHGLTEQGAIAFDAGWTGAEIRNCCRIASRLRLSLFEASKYIVPVCQADPASIETLRKMAEGRFLSANFPGTFSRQPVKTTGMRRVRES